MSNNSGLVRGLKKLSNKTNSKVHNTEKKDLTVLISVFALVISIASLYFQFFHKIHNLKTSLIDATITSDSINLNLIYQNRGNQDATIIASHIFFCTDKTEKMNKYHLEFINKENYKLPPFILSSGKQVFHSLSQKVYFDEEKILSESRIKKNDTIRIFLRINYINGSSLQAENITKCGWLTLDSLNKIDHWVVEYQNINLDYDSYFTRSYNYKKNK
jgi:hypothetical protein